MKAKISRWMKTYRERHPERVKDYEREYTKRPEVVARRRGLRSNFNRKDYERQYALRRRLELLERYGGKCACCGETRYQFLAIDHINGGGGKHRRTETGATNIGYYLRKQGFPEGYRVLCHNCNHAIARYTICPHTSIE